MFEKLREVRAALSEDENRPPYTMGSNDLLREIARTRPSDRNEMLRLKGMGERMFEKVGRPFLDVVDAFGGEPTGAPTAGEQPRL